MFDTTLPPSAPLEEPEPEKEIICPVCLAVSGWTDSAYADCYERKTLLKALQNEQTDFFFSRKQTN